MTKYRAGFLTLACVWMGILIQGLDAGHTPKKPAAAPCKPKNLIALTKSLVKESLRDFDEANGKHLGTWSPGFPELKVQDKSPLDWAKVQCSLLFMDQGLKKILEDQENNLNPTNVSLHEKLRKTISSVNSLADCLRAVLGGKCSPKPLPPQMPKHVFERKQWSHTLLKTARDYLEWLESKFGDSISKVRGTKKMKPKVTKTMLHNYLEGSGYLL